MSSASSEGAMTIMLGSVAMYVTSNAPQCVAPSAPTKPPRSIAKRTAAQNEGDLKTFVVLLLPVSWWTRLLCFVYCSNDPNETAMPDATCSSFSRARDEPL